MSAPGPLSLNKAHEPAGAPFRIGVVVIGRDLGPRLALALRSVLAPGRVVVYVDSASRDASPQVARDMGVDVVELGESPQLSASLGRNAGTAYLRGAPHRPEFVQFVDGDCELDPGWIDKALAFMRANADVAVVCGHVREKHASQSVAATLLDVDWGGPVGEIRACGGIFMARNAALQQVGGFSVDMPVGEEAELCARLRSREWRVVRIDHAMCVHDAAIHTLRGWWSRAVRVGRGFAHSARLQGPSADPAHRRRVRRVVLWTVLLPATALIGLVAGLLRPGWLLLPAGVLLLHGLQVVRMAARQRSAGRSTRVALQYGLFTMVAKWAHLTGWLQTRSRRPPR